VVEVGPNRENDRLIEIVLCPVAVTQIEKPSVDQLQSKLGLLVRPNNFGQGPHIDLLLNC
jgi:hypothetical protein